MEDELICGKCKKKPNLFFTDGLWFCMCNACGRTEVNPRKATVLENWAASNVRRAVYSRARAIESERRKKEQREKEKENGKRNRTKTTSKDVC